MSPAPPAVTSKDITFRVSDSDHELDGVRLELDWHSEAQTLDFSPEPQGWSLTIPRPEAGRLEYQLTLRTGDHHHWTTDTTNPRKVPNPFGPKSELLLPGYTEPGWLHSPDTGTVGDVVVPPGFDPPVPVRLWSPDGLAADTPAPLLIANDGSDLADRGSLLRWAGATVAGGRTGPFRVALLDPPQGYRDDWYAADEGYSDEIAGTVLPALRAAAPTTAVIGLGASLGAVAMLCLQDRHPDSVDALALQSGSFFTRALDPQESGFTHFERLCRAAERLAVRTTSRPVPVLLTCGTLEENRANNGLMAQALRTQGYPVRCRWVGDAHTMIGWRDAWGTDLADLIVAATDGWNP